MRQLTGAQKMAEVEQLLYKEIAYLLMVGIDESARLLARESLQNLMTYLKNLHALQPSFVKALVLVMSRNNPDKLQQFFKDFPQAVILLEGMSNLHLVQVLDVLYPDNALAVIQSISHETITRTIDGTPQRVSRAVILLEKLPPAFAAEVLMHDSQRGNGWWDQMDPDKANVIMEAMKMAA